MKEIKEKKLVQTEQTVYKYIFIQCCKDKGLNALPIVK